MARQTIQSPKKLGDSSNLLAQLSRAGKDLSYFQSRKPLGHRQRRRQAKEEYEFSLGALGGLRQRLKQFQAAPIVGQGFFTGKQAHCPRPRQEQVIRRPGRQPGRLKVARQLHGNLVRFSYGKKSQ